MRNIYINSNLDLITKFTSSSRSTKLKDILPWNISQMITKNRNLLKDWTIKINAILKGIKSENITETSRLIRACATFVGKKLGLKPKQRRGNPVKEPWWKRRIQQSIHELRKHINILE